jgi:DNA-binding protein H-NS
VAKLKLDNMTVAELVALRASVQAALLDKIEREKSVLRGQLETLSRLANGKSAMGARAKHGKVATRSGKPGGAGRKRGKVAPKYRGPGGETWTGRGRTPRWLAALEADGKKRESYLLKK